ncbi:MAG: hypothetical protein PHC60_09290 [Heliobacteriaceae bacterium]|nr:hypothetical protein [Heliobacteriaceae bacterium]MDD4588566.1 hypothetical protein [Heliobacteriaceae bacterium]
MVKKPIDGQQVTMVYPHVILRQIDEYKEKNGLTTRTSAVLELIRKGLEGSRLSSPKQ